MPGLWNCLGSYARLDRCWVGFFFCWLLFGFELLCDCFLLLVFIWWVCVVVFGWLFFWMEKGSTKKLSGTVMTVT